MLMETKSHSQVIVDMDKVKEDDAPEPRKEKLFRDESKQVKDHVKWLVFFEVSPRDFRTFSEFLIKSAFRFDVKSPLRWKHRD